MRPLSKVSHTNDHQCSVALGPALDNDQDNIEGPREEENPPRHILPFAFIFKMQAILRMEARSLCRWCSRSETGYYMMKRSVEIHVLMLSVKLKYVHRSISFELNRPLLQLCTYFSPNSSGELTFARGNIEHNHESF